MNKFASISLALVCLHAFALSGVAAEDGVIAKTDIVIATDVSGSMGHTDKTLHRVAGQATVLQLAALDEYAKVGMIQFTDKVVVDKERPLAQLPHNEALDKIIVDFEPKEAAGPTNLAAALSAARKLLEQSAADGGPRRLQAIILMSDGDYDRAESFLQGKQPAWRSGGAGSDVWDQVQALHKAGIVLYTIPITPLIDPQDAALEPPGSEKHRKWEAGHELLRQMAEVTGGQSFVRVPGKLSFAQIYQSIRERLFFAIKLRGSAADGVQVLPWHRHVIVVGPGLRGATTPTGHTLQFPFDANVPAGRVGPRKQGRVGDRGPTYTFRQFGETCILVFDRPAVADLAQELVLKSWEGKWTMDAPGVPAEEIETIATSDLSLTWTPPLTVKRWRHESVPIQIQVDSPLLRPGPGQIIIGKDSRLTCRVLFGPKGAPRMAELPVSQLPGDNRFGCELQLPSLGQFELVVELYGGSPGSAQLLLRAIQPVFVEEGIAITRSVFREANGKRELLFGPGVEGIRTVQPGGLIIFRFEWADPNVTITAEPVKDQVPDNLVRQRVAAPGGQAAEVVFSQRPGSPQSAAKPLELDLGVGMKQGPNKETVRQIRLSMPNPPVSAEKDMVLSARFIHDGPVPDLYVGENARILLKVQFNNLAKQTVLDASSLKIAWRHAAMTGSAYLATATLQGAPRDLPGGVLETDYAVMLPPELLRQEGDHVLQFDDAVLGGGVKIQGTLVVDVQPTPFVLIISQEVKASGSAGSSLLRAGEIVDIEVRSRPHASHVVPLEFRLVRKGSEGGVEMLESGLLTTQGQSRRASLGPLAHAEGVCLEVHAEVGPSGGGAKARQAWIRLTNREFSILSTPLMIHCDWRITSPANGARPIAFQPMTATIGFSIMGGDPDQRLRAEQELAAEIAMAGRDLVAEDGTGKVALHCNGPASRRSVPGLIDKNRAIRVEHMLNFRLGASGTAVLKLRPPKGISAPPPLVIQVDEPHFALLLGQRYLTDRPLMDSRLQNESLSRERAIDVLAGAPLVLELVPTGTVELTEDAVASISVDGQIIQNMEACSDRSLLLADSSAKMRSQLNKLAPGKRLVTVTVTGGVGQKPMLFGPVAIDVGGFNPIIKPIKLPPPVIPMDGIETLYFPLSTQVSLKNADQFERVANLVPVLQLERGDFKWKLKTGSVSGSGPSEREWNWNWGRRSDWQGSATIPAQSGDKYALNVEVLPHRDSEPVNMPFHLMNIRLVDALLKLEWSSKPTITADSWTQGESPELKFGFNKEVLDQLKIPPFAPDAVPSIAVTITGKQDDGGAFSPQPHHVNVGGNLLIRGLNAGTYELEAECHVPIAGLPDGTIPGYVLKHRKTIRVLAPPPPPFPWTPVLLLSALLFPLVLALIAVANEWRKRRERLENHGLASSF